MSQYRLLFVLLIGSVFTLSASAQAQLPGPELPKLSNLAFGWVSMSGVDPTLDMLTQFAPAMICLRDAGYVSGGEAVGGQLAFDDFKVASNFQSAITALGPGAVRIAHFGYSSNEAAVAGMQVPGIPMTMEMETSGDAVELSYAQHIGATTIGVSVIPEDASEVTVSSGGTTLMTGETETDYGVRVGGIVRLPHQVRVGADYSYQQDTGVARFMPAATGLEEAVTQEADFITRCATLGASWQMRPSTTVYAAYQKISATGENNFRRDANMKWFGVQQNITDKLALRTNYLGGGLNVSAQWISPYGIINAAYTHKALLNAKDILGEGDSMFIGMAVGF